MFFINVMAAGLFVLAIIVALAAIGSWLERNPHALSVAITCIAIAIAGFSAWGCYEAKRLPMKFDELNRGWKETSGGWERMYHEEINHRSDVTHRVEVLEQKLFGRPANMPSTGDHDLPGRIRDLEFSAREQFPESTAIEACK